MSNNWTFGQKLALGYAVTVLFAVIIGVVAIYALRTAVESKDRVLAVNAQALIDAEKLSFAHERAVSTFRGFLLTREERFLERMRAARGDASSILGRLKAAAQMEDARRQLEALERAALEYQQAADRLISTARSQAKNEAIVRQFDEEMVPKRDQLYERLQSFIAQQERLLEEAKKASTDAASIAVNWLIAIVAVAILFAVATATVLARSLGRQIGSAVGHVQSSSSELQAAATQQASGAKEQATAMNEISTTVAELVATSRQIAESAQRVAQIAERTAAAAGSGDATVQKGQESIAGIRRQVDQVVNHMLDLGKKSQEIGTVLDIVSELAEQTNILSINATIEAAGAGEAGKRFAVVADEIRKLADRVASSTKEVRALIDDVRGAVNTTVMATESGAKAVDAGARQFTEVAGAFKEIAGLVSTTSEAAREIELSTRQQATAAEQVRTAVTDVAQTTKETEASSGQTLQTASQLAGLSRELHRLVQPQAAA